ncbi:hypothetical protein V6N00_11135 [Tersicoccus sp. MR15.9]|uniref:hypothetical protein n=1 Tax=Tersicoccus mangrovi TaxID=3121635 RepID=UPI002FE6608B
MSLPTPLAVLLIIAGLWSLVAWGILAARTLRTARHTPTTTPGSTTGSTAGSTTEASPAAAQRTDDAAHTTAAPTSTPATTAPALPLLVVAVSITLALATLVIGFRALG